MKINNTIVAVMLITASIQTTSLLGMDQNVTRDVTVDELRKEISSKEMVSLGRSFLLNEKMVTQQAMSTNEIKQLCLNKENNQDFSRYLEKKLNVRIVDSNVNDASNVSPILSSTKPSPKTPPSHMNSTAKIVAIIGTAAAVSGIAYVAYHARYYWNKFFGPSRKTNNQQTS